VHGAATRRFPGNDLAAFDEPVAMQRDGERIFLPARRNFGCKLEDPGNCFAEEPRYFFLIIHFLERIPFFKIPD
jgi:hypothetical protein